MVSFCYIYLHICIYICESFLATEFLDQEQSFSLCPPVLAGCWSLSFTKCLWRRQGGKQRDRNNGCVILYLRYYQEIRHCRYCHFRFLNLFILELCWRHNIHIFPGIFQTKLIPLASFFILNPASSPGTVFLTCLIVNLTHKGSLDIGQQRPRMSEGAGGLWGAVDREDEWHLPFLVWG